MIPQIILLFLSFNLCYTHEVQQLKIPQTYDGFPIYGKQVLSVNSLTLEAFYDFWCPDCNASYPIVMQAIQNLKLNFKQNFTFLVHYFPLPYHRYSILGAQVEKYLKNKFGDDCLQQYMELIYKNQQYYWNNYVYNQTEEEIKISLAKLISSNFTQLTENDIMGALHNSTLADQAAESWQYGCTRGVSGTPTYFANGVEITNGYSFNLDQWTEFLQGFYSSGNIQ